MESPDIVRSEEQKKNQEAIIYQGFYLMFTRQSSTKGKAWKIAEMIDYLAPGYKIPSSVYFFRDRGTRVVPRCEVKNHSATVICPRSLLVTQLIFRCQSSLSILMAHFITSDFEQKSYILATHVAERICAAIALTMEYGESKWHQHSCDN